jgi:hypothetical protein
MEQGSKESIIRIKKMEKENFIGATEMDIQDSSEITRGKEKE